MQDLYDSDLFKVSQEKRNIEGIFFSWWKQISALLFSMLTEFSSQDTQNFLMAWPLSKIMSSVPEVMIFNPDALLESLDKQEWIESLILLHIQKEQ